MKQSRSLKKRIAFPILAVLLTLPLSLVQGALRCQLCGQEISGVYYTTADGRIYCDSCWTKHAICSQCGQLFSSVIKVDGRNFCAGCLSRIEKCGLCGKPLIGTYTHYPDLNLKVCSKCETETPRCDKCGVPSKELIKTARASLCPRCFRGAERCHSCGEPILHDFSFFEGNRDAKYCFDCTNRFPQCDNCGAPIGPSGTRLDDGRDLCPDCRAIAYFDAGLIGSVRKRVFAFATEGMGLKVSHRIDFSIVGRGFLETKAEGIHGDLNGLFRRKGDSFFIYVLYGLREKDLIGVLAHEWAHAWQAEHSIRDIPLEDQEGFAQWVAYKTLIGFGHEDFAHLMTEGDNMYARGLVKALRIEENDGTGRVYEFGRNGK